jgi:hypothetical protein
MAAFLSNLPWIILSLILTAGVVLAYLGLNNRIVIYFDIWDLLRSFMAVACTIFGVLFYVSGQNEDVTGIGKSDFYLWFGFPVSMTAGFLCFASTAYSSFKHNRSWTLGAVVTIFKIAITPMVSLFIFMCFARYKNKKLETSQRLTALTLIYCIALIMCRLVNGPEVYAIRGWPLPMHESDESDVDTDRISG